MSIERLQGEAGNARVIAGGALAAALIAGGVVFNATRSGSDSEPTTDRSEIAELFKIDTVTADCIEIAGEAGTATVDETLNRVLPEIGALKPVNKVGGQDNRKWADALSNPLTTGLESETLETEVKASLCEDPLLAVTFANFFANMEVDGVNIGELNADWLGEYAGSQDDINDKAAELVPLLDHEGDISSDEADAALAANAKHQDLAERLATLLDRLSNEGVQVSETQLNYHLAAAGMTVGQLPEVELNGVQYKGIMLVIAGEAKDGRCLVRIGVNIEDQRPVVLSPEDCVVETTVTNPDGSTTTTLRGTTTTTNPDGSTTTTSWRTSNTVTASTVFQGPGSGGTPGGGSSTSTTENTATTDTTIRAGGSTTTTEAVPPTTDTTVITG